MVVVHSHNTYQQHSTGTNLPVFGNILTGLYLEGQHSKGAVRKAKLEVLIGMKKKHNSVLLHE